MERNGLRREVTGLRDGEAGELHELVDGKGADAQEVFVQSCCALGREELEMMGI